MLTAEKKIYLQFEKQIDKVFTKEKRKSINKILDDLVALPEIKGMIVDGDIEKTKKCIRETIDESINRLQKDSQPIIITCKDGSKHDLSRIVMIVLSDEKLDYEFFWRNGALNLLKIIGGCIMSFIIYKVAI